jgi:exosortase
VKTLAFRGEKSKIASVLGAILGVLLLFYYYGSTVWQDEMGGSLFAWLYGMWVRESTEAVDYSHGLVIPFISAWFVWRQRKDWVVLWRSGVPHYFGFILLGCALVMHATGLRMQVPHLSALALIASLWALVWAFLGKKAALQAMFPVGFLLFAVPVSFLAHATFPLRMLGSVVSTYVLNGIGIPTEQEGTAVVSYAGQGFRLDVADECSGIRSIMALMALTAAYAYVYRKNWPERGFLFVMSIPVAVVANIARIITIAILARFWGQEFAMTIYHDYSGYLLFSLCVFIVMGLNALLDHVSKGFGMIGRKLRAG